MNLDMYFIHTIQKKSPHRLSFNEIQRDQTWKNRRQTKTLGAFTNEKGMCDIIKRKNKPLILNELYVRDIYNKNLFHEILYFIFFIM